MMKLSACCIFCLALLGLAAGCAHGQLPPTPPAQVNVTWPAPATGGPYTYVVSRTAFASGACPTPATAAPFNYTPLNPSAAVSTTSFVDTNPPAGNIACYSVQSEAAGAISDPSPASNALQVPASILAPGQPTATEQTAKAGQLQFTPEQAQILAKLKPSKDFKGAAVSSVTARIERR